MDTFSCKLRLETDGGVHVTRLTARTDFINMEWTRAMQGHNYVRGFELN